MIVCCGVTNELPGADDEQGASGGRTSSLT